MWNDKYEQAIDILKDALTNAPSLATIDYNANIGIIILSVDANGEG